MLNLELRSPAFVQGFLIDFEAVVELAKLHNIEIDTQIFHNYDEFISLKANPKQTILLARKRIENSEAHINNWLVDTSLQLHVPVYAASWIRWSQMSQQTQSAGLGESAIIPQLRDGQWYLLIGEPLYNARNPSNRDEYIRLQDILLKEDGGMGLRPEGIHEYATFDPTNLASRYALNSVHGVHTESWPSSIQVDSDDEDDDEDVDNSYIR